MKKFLSLLLLAALVLGLAACGSKDTGSSGVSSILNAPISSSNDTPTAENDSAVITLSGSSASAEGRGVSIDGSTVTIKAAGNYTLTGKLDDGKIVINTGDDKGKIKLILDNADITCLTGPAIEVQVADSVKLYLADGSLNTLTSGTEADIALCDDSKTGGAIHTGADLDIKCDGNASLYINGYINNGITCKADFDLCGGNVVIRAANNGIKATKSLEIKGGSLTIDAGKDGMKATNLTTEGKGYVTIEDGSVNITAVGDGISAATLFTVNGGNVTVTTTGDAESTSCKGLKTEASFVMNGGSVTVNAADCALRANGDITVNGGSLTLSSAADRGMYANGSITCADGTVAVCAAKAGIACGDASSGFGHTGGVFTLGGGAVTVSSTKSAISALDSIVTNGGSLIACGNGTKMPAAAGSIPAGVVSLRGSEGTEIRCGSLSLTAANAFSYVLVASAELSAGSSFTVTAGPVSAEGTAN